MVLVAQGAGHGEFNDEVHSPFPIALPGFP